MPLLSLQPIKISHQDPAQALYLPGILLQFTMHLCAYTGTALTLVNRPNLNFSLTAMFCSCEQKRLNFLPDFMMTYSLKMLPLQWELF